MKRHSKKRFDALKRIFAILLVCAMLFSNVTSTAVALGNEVNASTEEGQGDTGEPVDTLEAGDSSDAQQDQKESDTSGSDATTSETPEGESKSEGEQTIPSNASETNGEQKNASENNSNSEDEAVAEATEEKKEPTRAEGEETNEATEPETWTVTFYDRDADVYQTVSVVKGKAIGSQLPETIAREDYNAYWAIGEIVESPQGTEIKVTGDRIDSTFVPSKKRFVQTYENW